MSPRYSLAPHDSSYQRGCQMRNYFLSVAAIGLACAITAGAQDYGRRYDRDHDRRDAYSRFDRDIIGRTMSDLSRVGAYSGYDHHNRKRVDHAQRELMKFQEKWARGGFDSHPLDEAIDEMKDLVRSDHVGPRERIVLMRDIEGLRDFRANRGYYDRDRDDRYRGDDRWRGDGRYGDGYRR